MCMSVNIVVPDLGEAGEEATVSRWLKAVGDAVKSGEAVVVLETDKVDVEVSAEADGVLANIERQAGDDVTIGEVLGSIDASASAAPDAKEEQAESRPQPVAEEQAGPAAEKPKEPAAVEKAEESKATPVARRLAQERSIDLAQVQGSGPQGRVTREDVEKHISRQAEPREDGQKSAPARPEKPAAPQQPARELDAGEERVRMSRRRRTIARRLVEAQQTAAMMTTF